MKEVLVFLALDAVALFSIVCYLSLCERMEYDEEWEDMESDEGRKDN